MSTKTCYDKYTKHVCVYYPFSCHSIPAMLKSVYLYYMEVSICCSALYTPGTSQMVEYTLNELTDMHLLYGDTVLTQHWIGQGEDIATCFHWMLNVNKYTVSTRAEVWSSPTLLSSHKHVNKQTELHTIALHWCTPAQKNKNRWTKSMVTSKRRLKRHRLFNKKCSLLLTLSTLRVCLRGFESPCKALI